jgi:hypothetical protein
VTPVLASKYPPGHSLLLVPGIWLSADGIVPLLLSAFTAAVLVAVVAQRWGVTVAMLTWALWLASPLGLHFRATYFSEVTTALLWVVGWWCLGRWWDDGWAAYLVGLAGVVGWMAITRPLTAVAYAIPITVVVVPRVWRERRWPAFGAAFAAGSLVLVMLPIWSRAVTGSWERTPLAIYTAQYIPWDRMGFGLDSTAPLRAGPPDMPAYSERFKALHRNLTPAGAAQVAFQRARGLKNEVWGAGALLAIFFVFVGIRLADRRLVLGLAQATLLFLLYAVYAHGLTWNVYYLEALPVLCIMPVLGLISLGGRSAAAPVALSKLLVAGTFALLALTANASIQQFHRVGTRGDPYRRLRAAVASAPRPAVVFVRRSAPHASPTPQLVENVANMEEAPVWLAHDLGERNPELLERVGGRVPFVFDEATGRLQRLEGPRR